MRKTGCREIYRYYLTIKIIFYRKLKILFYVYSARAIGQYFFGSGTFFCANQGRLTIKNHAATICLQSCATQSHIVTTFFVVLPDMFFSCQWRFVSKFAKTRRFAAICNRICAKFAIFRQKYKTSDKTVTKSTCNVVI